MRAFVLSLTVFAVAMSSAGCAGFLAGEPQVEHPALAAIVAAQDAGVSLISLEELRTGLISKNPPIIVDVLPPASYDTTHIKGSINIAVAELQAKAAEKLPNKDAWIVTYCDNYGCGASTEGAVILMKMGYTHVQDYKGGLNEWTLMGLPLEGQKAPEQKGASTETQPADE